MTRFEPGRGAYGASWTSSARATATRCSPTTGARSTSRWPSCCARAGSHGRRRRSRAPAGCWPARLTELAGLLGLRARRAGRLLQRGEGRAGGRRPGAHRAHGAVSPEVAEALADGARARAWARTSASGSPASPGPGGGTRGEAGGLVCFCVAGRRGGRLTRELQLPGDRADVRDRRRPWPCTSSGGCWPATAGAAAASVRLFVALELPEDVRDALAAWGRAAARRTTGPAPVAPDGAAPHAVLPRGWARDDRPRGRADARARPRGARRRRSALGGALWLAPRRPRVLDGRGRRPRRRAGRLQAAWSARWPRGRGWEPEAAAVPPARDGGAGAPRRAPAGRGARGRRRRRSPPARVGAAARTWARRWRARYERARRGPSWRLTAARDRGRAHGEVWGTRDRTTTLRTPTSRSERHSMTPPTVPFRPIRPPTLLHGVPHAAANMSRGSKDMP